MLRSRNVSVATLLVVMVAAAMVVAVAGAGAKDKVLLTDVKALTLGKGKLTTGRRSSPVAQLACTSGPCQHAPEVVQCINMGSDGYDVQWKCDADLPHGVSFGRINVMCEGYEYPEDPHVLRGSCGLEYALKGQSAADQHQHQKPTYAHYDGGYGGYNTSSSARGGLMDDLLGLLVFVFIVGVVYLLFCAGPSAGTPAASRQGGGGYGGGGYGGGAPGCAPSMPYVPPAQHGGGPGFWTGLGMGGLMGNMFGGWNRPAYGGGYGGGYGGYGRPRPAYGGGGGGFFGGGGGGGGFASSSGGGGGSRTASGFGGTSRR